jgi:dTMP kinase
VSPGRRGLFVVFEGGDGVGKSTQVDLLCAGLSSRGLDVVRTHEPGDTRLGREIRRILLDPAHSEMAARTEALLYAADKAQHVAEVVRPALDRGAVVVCDRYVDSMIAYQGAGRVLEIADVVRLARWATDDLRPDLTVVLDVEPALSVRGKTDKDRVEAAGDEFHQRARRHFLALAAEHPDHYLVLPGRLSRRQIANAVTERVLSALGAVEVSVDPGTLER